MIEIMHNIHMLEQQFDSLNSNMSKYTSSAYVAYKSYSPGLRGQAFFVTVKCKNNPSEWK